MKFFRDNGLTITLLIVTALCIVGMVASGLKVENEMLANHGQPPLSVLAYMTSGSFISALFENWESEFLQMALYVLLTVWLRQRGSSESKKLYEKEEVDAEPNQSKKDAPWPVRQGGLVLKLYKSSLSIAFFALFLGAFFLHAQGGAEVYSIEQVHDGKSAVDIWEYMGTSRFWFESLQNWQSEFLAIWCMVVLSIFLRQRGSPESKPVAAPHTQTGD